MKKNLLNQLSKIILISLIFATNSFSQGLDETIKVPLTNPNERVYLKISWNIEGNVTVIGTDAKEVEVNIVASDEGNSRSRSSRNRRGLKRLNVGGNKTSISENNNTVEIRNSFGNSEGNVIVKIPKNSDVYIRTMDDGDIKVSNVSGEIDVSNLNGDHTVLENVSGTVIANTLNGDLMVSMLQVNQDTPHSFRAMNGEIEVSLPANLKATFIIQNTMGEVLTDFDLVLKNDWNKKETKRGFEYSKNSKAELNGGGVEMTFFNFNDDIIIIKNKK